MESNLCLFCTSPCSPTFTIIDGQIIRVKSERDDDDHHQHFFLEEESPPLLGEQLKVIFILKNILGIKEEMLCGFLRKLEGALHPQFWLQVCSSCEETVSEYYRVLKQFLTLEKKLKVISDELKSRIWETGQMDVNYDDGDRVTAQVWSEVRAEIMKKFENTSSPSHPYKETPSEIIIVAPSFLAEEDESNNEVEEKYPVDASSFAIFNQDEAFPDSLAGPPYSSSFHHTATTQVNPCPSSSTSKNVDKTKKTSVKLPSSNLLKRRNNHKEMIHPNRHDVNVPNARKEKPGPRFASQVWKEQILSHPVANVKEEPSSVEPEEEPEKRYFSYKDGKQTKLKCLDCVATYNRPYEMVKHLNYHLPGASSTPCKICGWMVDASKAAYTNHLYFYHDIPVNKTNSDHLLPTSFPSASNTTTKTLQSGKVIHLQRECDICGTLVRKTFFQRHLEARHNLIGHVAKKVARTEKTILENDYYKVTSNGDNVRWFKCKKCPIQFHTKKLVVTHLELHKDGSGAVICGICKWAMAPDRVQLHNENHHHATEKGQHSRKNIK